MRVIDMPELRPKVNPQHCVRTRFNGSSCSLCRDACPQGIPELDGPVSIDFCACSGCLLCSAACPNGAIEPQLTAEEIATVLNLSLPIMLACHIAAEECHLRTPCLGFVTDEYLLAFQSAISPAVGLNLIHCGSCVNRQSVARVRERIDALEGKTGLPIAQKVSVVERAGDMSFQPETLGRRDFFTSLTRRLLREASQVLAPPVNSREKRISYAEKRLPLRRILLHAALKRVSAGERQRIAELFNGNVVRSDACEGCRACTKMCPTGALIENTDRDNDAPPFTLEPANCTGCGLCVAFCLNKALSLSA